MVKRLLLAGLLAAFTACSSPAATSDPPSPNPRPPAASQTTTLPELPASATAPSGQSGLTGQIVAASDVSGQPDEPLAGQMVLAVPAAQAGEVLGVSGDQLAPETLRFLKANLPEADPAITVTLSDTAGNYTLLLNPGQVVLCAADSELTPPDFPATTRGCGLTEVRLGELRRVDISSGFGEILLGE
jgi:hypothetical protein